MLSGTEPRQELAYGVYENAEKGTNPKVTIIGSDPHIVIGVQLGGGDNLGSGVKITLPVFSPVPPLQI